MNALKKIKGIILILIITVAGLEVAAQQNFRYQSVLQKVDSDGFYRISLMPGLVAKGKTDLADLRITDDKNHFIPFMFGNQLMFKDKASFIPFPLLQRSTTADSVTTFIADNRSHLTLNHLYLQLRNTAVQRLVNLSGSDDLEHWYAIKENIALADTDAGFQDKGTYMQVLNFPASTYRYLKIQVFNKNKEPVAILQAGVYQQQLVKPVYLKIAGGTIQQKDSAGVSSILLRLNDYYQINKLQLTIKGQKFYKRNIAIYEIDGKIRNRVSDTVVSSSNAAELYLSAKTDKVLIEITNGDNPPLEVDHIDAYQLDQSVISYLEKGREYHLLLGDPQAVIPDYDLKFFADSVQHQLKKITHTQIGKNPLFKIKSRAKLEKRSKWSEWLLGFSVTIAIVLLIALTSRMVREVNKRKEEQNNS
jgi:hypothetical protein